MLSDPDAGAWLFDESTGGLDRFHLIGAVFRDYLDENGFADYLGSPLALSPEDGHPSRLAHRIAGEALVDALQVKLVEAPGTQGR